MLAGLLCLALIGIPRPPVATAQLGSVPAVGEVLFEDSLFGPSLVTARACETGRGSLQYGADGLRMRATGRCTNNAGVAAGPAAELDGLVLGDGDVSFDVRPVAGSERLAIRVGARIPTGGGGYSLSVGLGEGTAVISRFGQGGAPPTTLARVTNQAFLTTPTDWVAVSIRADGPNLSVLVNGAVIVQASDETHARGAAWIQVYRTGALDDEVEVAADLRNLRVSRLAGGEAERASTFAPRPIAGGLGLPALSFDLRPGEGVNPMSCSDVTGSRFGDSGYQITVRGRCNAGTGSAGYLTYFPIVQFRDGEVSVEYKVLAGHERAAITLMGRMAIAPTVEGYVAAVIPSLNGVALLRAGGGSAQAIGRRIELGAVLAESEWTRLSLRMAGSSMLVSVNGRAILSAADVTRDNGNVSIGVDRIGSGDDDFETTVAFRRFRVSGFDSGDPARQPIVTVPSGAPTSSG
jgi:hypothetical protein